MWGALEPRDSGTVGGSVTHSQVRCEVVAGIVEGISALG